MRAGEIPAGVRTGVATFEVERFEWAAPDRLEVAGRWYGVRGLRFVRPSLDLQENGDRHHLLALLEHKPWAALDGEEWVAAFPCADGPLKFSEAELAVAPSVTVDLPPPGGSRRRRTRQPRSGQPADGDGRKPTKRSRIRSSGARSEPPNNRALAAAQELRAELDAAIAERAGVARELGAALEARDAAGRERDRAVRERHELAKDRDELAMDRDAAIAARDAALAELESVMSERDEAIAGLALAERARETAAAEHEAAARERKAAIEERDRARRERDELRARLEAERQVRAAATAHVERDELRARVASEARVPRERTASSPQPPPPPPAGTAPATSRWRPRVAALGALGILLAIAAAVLHGIL